MNSKAITIALAGLALAGFAPVAHAETVGVDGSGTVFVTAGPGENNKMGFQSWDDTHVAVYDSAATVTSVSPLCSQEGDNTVVCPLDPARGGRADLGDGDDWGYVSFDLPKSASFTIAGGAGNDRLQGSIDGNPVNLDGGAGNDSLQGGPGIDTLTGGDGNDTLKGLAGADHLYGGAGNDNLDGDSNQDPSPDVIDGGPGVDTVDADWETEDDAPVSVTLAGGADDGRAGEGDSVTGVETIITHQGSTLIGTDAPEHLEAFQTDAPSKLVGNGGDDTLRGSDGPDVVDGGAGNDEIDAGFGDDVITGGPGRDRISGDRHNGECGYLWCKYPWGNDTIYARDGEVDSIDCGAGDDTVYADPVDVISSDCEHIIRGAGGPSAGGGAPGSGAKLTAAVVRTRLARALAHGLKLRVTAPAAGRLTASARYRGRVVARGSRQVKAGAATVVLRFTREARHRLRHAHTLKLTLTVNVAGARLTEKVVL
jgi:Ca2+-binding RTX toxin-like protein